MEVTYRLTMEDFFLEQRVLHDRVNIYLPWPLRERALGYAILSAVLLATLLCALLEAHGIISGSFTNGAMVGGVLVYLSLDILGLSQRRAFWTRCVHDHPQLRQRHLKLSETGIEIIDSDHRSRRSFAWAAIEDVSREGKLVMLWLHYAYAISIPAAAFPDDSAVKHFISEIRARLTSAAEEKPVE